MAVAFRPRGELPQVSPRSRLWGSATTPRITAITTTDIRTTPRTIPITPMVAATTVQRRVCIRAPGFTYSHLPGLQLIRRLRGLHYGTVQSIKFRPSWRDDQAATWCTL